MVMTRSDRDDRRTRDGFVMDCPVCGAYLRWAHIEASANGSKCTFCGTTIVPTRPDGFRDVDERLVEIEDLGLIGGKLEETPSLLEPIRQTPRIPGWVFVVVSLLAIVGMGVWRLANSPSSPAAPISAAREEPSVHASVPPASKGEPETQAPSRITAVLHIDQRSWVEAWSDGKIVAATVYEAPDKLVLHAKHKLLLTIGFPDGVRLVVGGDPVPLASPSTTHLTLTLSGGHVRVTKT
jgi:hypothetical protein